MLVNLHRRPQSWFVVVRADWFDVLINVVWRFGA